MQFDCTQMRVQTDRTNRMSGISGFLVSCFQFSKRSGRLTVCRRDRQYMEMSLLKDFKLQNGHIQQKGTAYILSAGAGTDLFIDPATGQCKMDGAQFYSPVIGDFIFQARVDVPFSATYDAGALFVRSSPDTWAKLAYEQTDLGYPAAVSVVTRTVSDDCNGPRLSGPSVKLKIVRKGGLFVFFYAENNGPDQMLRYFSLPAGPSVAIGLAAQSPCGLGIAVSFSDISLTAITVQNARKGR